MGFYAVAGTKRYSSNKILLAIFILSSKYTQSRAQRLSYCDAEQSLAENPFKTNTFKSDPRTYRNTIRIVRPSHMIYRIWFNYMRTAYIFESFFVLYLAAAAGRWCWCSFWLSLAAMALQVLRIQRLEIFVSIEYAVID